MLVHDCTWATVMELNISIRDSGISSKVPNIYFLALYTAFLSQKKIKPTFIN